VCISKRWSSSTNCEIFRGQRPLAAEIWASKKVDWMGRNEGPIFSVCGPKFTKFGRHVTESLQFLTPFSDRRYLVLIRRYSRSNCKVQNFEVFGPPNVLGSDPQISLNFINYSHRQTCGKIWWRSAQRPPRLGGEKNKEDRNISSKI